MTAQRLTHLYWFASSGRPRVHMGRPAQPAYQLLKLLKVLALMVGHLRQAGPLCSLPENCALPLVN